MGRPRCSLFNELCFCILTANYNAERAIAIQNEVGDGFAELSEPELASRLKELGYRFPNVRAKYIVCAREHPLEKLKFNDERELRDWLVENVKGLGLKEASHFLRNIGFKDVAIIDFHIIDALVEHKIIAKPKTLTRKKYLMIEEKLREMAGELGITLAELDLYLWYLETGKILK